MSMAARYGAKLGSGVPAGTLLRRKLWLLLNSSIRLLERSATQRLSLLSAAMPTTWPPNWPSALPDVPNDAMDFPLVSNSCTVLANQFVTQTLLPESMAMPIDR